MGTRQKKEQSCAGETNQLLSRMPFKQVMELLSANEMEKAHALCTEHRFRPKLGQLLIASGRLTASDLDSMLVVHESEGMKTVPMGKLLVVAGLLSADELMQYFELQKMLSFPSRQSDTWGQNLVAKGLLTQDQLNTALNDNLVSKCSLKESLKTRGWLSQEIDDQPDSPPEA